MADDGAPPDFEAIRIFLAAADEGSVYGAAERLGTSRARVRRRLDQLEAALGVTLLRRSRDGIDLTEDGARFAERARPLLADAQRLFVRVQHESRSAAPLRIGLQVGYPTPLAVKIALTVAERVPEARTSYRIAERPTELLPEEADLVLCLGEQRPPTPCRELVVAYLEVRLHAAPGWLAQHGTPSRVPAMKETA